MFLLQTATTMFLPAFVGADAVVFAARYEWFAANITSAFDMAIAALITRVWRARIAVALVAQMGCERVSTHLTKFFE